MCFALLLALHTARLITTRSHLPAALTKAVETNSKDLSKIVAEIELERIRDEMDERKRIASRRSGARSVRVTTYVV